MRALIHTLSKVNTWGDGGGVRDIFTVHSIMTLLNLVLVYFQGGFFMWIELPETMHCLKLEELCKQKYKVLFHGGHR